MITEYKISSSLAPIMLKPSYFSLILCIFFKNTIINVKSISNGWACFELLRRNVYINEQFLEKTYYNLGSINIQYIDFSSGLLLSNPVSYTNLEYGTYSYTAKIINGYTIFDENTQTVTLNENNKNATITFNYYKILGSVKISYLDFETDVELLNSTTFNNLSLGIYSYSAVSINRYSIIDDSTKSVELTQDNPNVNIVFYYSKIKIEIPIDLNINEIPYISTYYINPTVTLNEEVFIDFYITDYYQKEYQDEDFSEVFDVTVKVDGKKNRTYTNLKAGDNTISLGSFNNEGIKEFSIYCTDKYGRKSQEIFKEFLVQDTETINEYIMTEDDLEYYNIKKLDIDYEIKLPVDTGITLLDNTDITPILNILQSKSDTITLAPNSYICVYPKEYPDIKYSNSLSLTPGDYWYKMTVVKYSDDYDFDKIALESENTRIGLQKLIDNKKSEGFNKLKLLPGIYRIDHLSPIYIPTEFTLDMNGSTIKQNQFTFIAPTNTVSDRTAMIELNYTFNSHVINGTIEGDYYAHDYSNSTNDSEWIFGVSINGECKYSSLDNLTIKDITGYGVTGGLANRRNESSDNRAIATANLNNSLKLADINTNNGDEVSSTTRLTSDFIDISDFLNYGYIGTGVYLMYGGITGKDKTNTWNQIIHFYDENKNYIESINSQVYRRIKIPKDSKFAKLTLLTDDYSSNTQFNLFYAPINCSFNNLEFENIRCVGMALSQMYDTIIEDCKFTRSGQTLARCAIDLEDGWERMIDYTLRNLDFIDCPTNDITVFAGENINFENINGSINLAQPKIHSYSIKNCSNLKNVILNYENILKSGCARFNNITVNNYVSVKTYDNYDLKVLLKNWTINGGTSSSVAGSCEFINCIIDKSIYSNPDPYSPYSVLGTGIYKNCTISNKSTTGYHTTNLNCEFRNCTIENITQWFGGNIKFYNCQLNNFSPGRINDNKDNSSCILSFYNCTLQNSYLTLWSWSKGATITLESCHINNKDFLIKLPHHSLKYPITINNSSFISTGKNGLVLFYNDTINSSTGEYNISSIIITNNSINLANSLFVLNGLTPNTQNIINIIVSNNYLYPKNILFIKEGILSNSNIRLIQSYIKLISIKIY